MAALAVIAVVCCALGVWIKLALVAAILLGLWHAAQVGLTSPVAAVGFDAGSGWSLRLREGEDVSATLASFRLLGALVLLRLATTERGTQLILLAPDNSDDDTRRRLRMRLAALPADGESIHR